MDVPKNSAIFIIATESQHNKSVYEIGFIDTVTVVDDNIKYMCSEYQRISNSKEPYQCYYFRHVRSGLRQLGNITTCLEPFVKGEDTICLELKRLKKAIDKVLDMSDELYTCVHKLYRDKGVYTNNYIDVDISLCLKN